MFENVSENNLKSFKANKFGNTERKKANFGNPEPMALNQDSLTMFDRQTNKNKVVQLSNIKQEEQASTRLLQGDDVKS